MPFCLLNIYKKFPNRLFAHTKGTACEDVLK